LKIPLRPGVSPQSAPAEFSDFDALSVPQSAISEMQQEITNGVSDEAQLKQLKQLQLQLAQPAQAAEKPIIGVPTILSVRPHEDVEAECRYIWSVVSKPPEAAQPVFGINGSNNARQTHVRFQRAGKYVVRVTVYRGAQTQTSDLALDVANAMA
jgi:hypothetical protein